MVIITSRHDDAILNYGKEVTYLDNGYPCLVNENLSFPKETVYVYENVTLPDDYYDGGFCYTPERGFFKKKFYTPPVTQDDVTDNQKALVELAEYAASLEERIASLEGGAK